MARTVEMRGTTVEEATAAALGELGIAAHEAIIEVLAEGRRGIFGGGRRAHVRVTAKEPESAANGDTGTSQTPEEDGVTQPDTDVQDSTNELEPGAAEPEETEQAAEIEDQPDAEQRLNELDEEADLAADFVEGLLDRLDLPGDIEIEITEAQAIINVSDVGSGLLIGRRGVTLDALQELVRCATQRQTERRAHVRIDVEGYRARQLEKLRDKCREAIAEVRETGEPVRLEPMDAYERKMMHDLIAKTGGVTSSSEGNEPKRRVVINASEE